MSMRMKSVLNNVYTSSHRIDLNIENIVLQTNRSLGAIKQVPRQIF